MVHSSLWYCKLIQVAKAKSTVSWFLSVHKFSYIMWPPPSTLFNWNSRFVLFLCLYPCIFLSCHVSPPPHSGPASKKGNFPMEQIRDTGGEPASFQHRHSIITIIFTPVIVIGATLVKNIISWKFLPWNRTYTSQPFAPYVGNGLNIPQQITLFLIQMAFIAFTSS